MTEIQHPVAKFTPVLGVSVSVSQSLILLFLCRRIVVCVTGTIE